MQMPHDSDNIISAHANPQTVGFRTAGRGYTSFAILRIPVLVQRPPPTTQARRPSPLMPAARTQPARVKRIPFHAAAVEEIFGVVALAALPRTHRVRPPPAQRTTNVAVVRLFVVRLVNGIGRILRRQVLLGKREDGY